jgi:RNA polymerase sigma-70 factor (ECF subfamily)
MDNGGRFERILRTTHSQIRAYIAGMGVAPDEVDDIAQEVYIALYRGMRTISDEVSPIAWLKGTARNLCLNHFRKEKRYREHFRQIAEIMQRTRVKLEDVAGDDSAREALESCLERLSPKHRELVGMRYEQGMTAESIAREKKSPGETIRTALHRIRNFLRDCISSKLALGGAE